MRLLVSSRCSPDALWGLLRDLEAQGLAPDVFCGQGGGLQEDHAFSLFAGLVPDTELLVDKHNRTAVLSGGGQALKTFCFRDERPVLGFFGYELGMERLGLVSAKERELPLAHLKKYAVYLTYREESREVEAYCREDAPPEEELREAVMDAVLAASTVSAPPRPKGPPAVFEPGLVQSLDRDAYLAGVEKTLEHIRRGDCYQLNLSTAFTATTRELRPLALFEDLWRRLPAAHYALFASPPHHVLSTSPERFLRVRGEDVLSQPIKGTLAFSHQEQGDLEALHEQLRRSPKEDAELSMIVDLVRNDISAHCDYGSVRVFGHKSTFVVDRLIHMYSNVSGMLRKGRDVIDLILDAFPPGSVTGCPKRRAMEIIEELEPHTRDVYCGGMALIQGPRHMDMNVAIRTAHWHATEQVFRFFAGSGIVVDSLPEKEYRETMAKASKFLDLLPGSQA